MRRTCVILATLLVGPACDSTDKPADQPSTAKKPAAAKPDAKKPAAPKPEEVDPFQAKLDARVLADSGLDKDSKFIAFQIVNCETGKEYCQVCKFGSKPKLMAVGSADDAAFLEDLKNLDAIAKKYGEDKLKAFAVITDIEDGKALTPTDPEAAKGKAQKIKEKLGISMPVVVPAQRDGGENREWSYYNVTKSRTVMFADGGNHVKYSGVAPSDWSSLNDAITSVVSAG